MISSVESLPVCLFGLLLASISRSFTGCPMSILLIISVLLVTVLSKDKPEEIIGFVSLLGWLSFYSQGLSLTIMSSMS